MTTDERTAGWIRELVRSSEVPVVLDADGLNAFAGRAEDLADRKADADPHAARRRVRARSRVSRPASSPPTASRHVRELAARTSAPCS